MNYVEKVLIPATNKRIEGKYMNLTDFFVFVGLILFMSLYVGCNRNDFFTDALITLLHGAPICLSVYMSGWRFNNILKALSFTSDDAPPFKDKFWEIRRLIKEWNDHMKEVFMPSWVSCLDESISPWTNKFTCPGFILCPCKPHNKGNEYHFICCSLSHLMFAIDLREGKKDHPKEIKPEFHKFSATVSLLLRLTKDIFGTGKVVILDSGFCVLRGLVELMKRGVYASSLIKKRKY